MAQGPGGVGGSSGGGTFTGGTITTPLIVPGAQATSAPSLGALTGGGQVGINLLYNGQLEFITDGAHRGWVDTSGNLVWGASSSTATGKVSIQGAGTTTGHALSVKSSAGANGTETFYVQDNGNIFGGGLAQAHMGDWVSNTSAAHFGYGNSSSNIGLVCYGTVAYLGGLNMLSLGTGTSYGQVELSPSSLTLNASTDLMLGKGLSIGTATTAGTGKLIIAPNSNNTRVGGVVKKFIASVGNITTGEDDLFTYTTPASTMGATEESLFWTVGGNYAGLLTATKQIKAYFAGTMIYDSGAVTLSALGDWSLQAEIIRTGTSTARSIVSLNTTGASNATYTKETDLTGLTFTATNIIKITGEAAGTGPATDDIVAKLGTLRWEPAGN